MEVLELLVDFLCGLLRIRDLPAPTHKSLPSAPHVQTQDARAAHRLALERLNRLHLRADIICDGLEVL